jgi:hypothetical protein
MVGNSAVAAALDRLAATVREQHQSMAEQYSGLREMGIDLKVSAAEYPMKYPVSTP